ncbi:MAG: ABC transporter permease [Gemmatimonadaceae bacterium]
MADSVLTAFLESTVRTATPLALAALGETLCERTGIINLGMEGAIIAGALGAAVGAATGGVVLGVAGGTLAGFITAAVFAVFVVWLRTDQIITGTAITLGALGLTSALYRIAFGAAGAALTLPTLAPLPIPFLSSIPVVGTVFFRQPLPTYVAFALAPLCAWFLFRTRLGLIWRATGESPEAVRASGSRPVLVQLAGVLVGGSLGGFAGASLVLAQVGTFADGMSAGRGFIAIAVVALGRWRPYGVLAAAMLFGASSALQYLFQATGSALPYQLFLALPYMLTLAVLALGAGRGASPATLGRQVDSHGYS